EHARSEQEAGRELAHHGGLPEPPQQGAERPRRREQREQLEPEDQELVLARQGRSSAFALRRPRRGGPRRRRGGSPAPRAARAAPGGQRLNIRRCSSPASAYSERRSTISSLLPWSRTSGGSAGSLRRVRAIGSQIAQVSAEGSRPAASASRRTASQPLRSSLGP